MTSVSTINGGLTASAYSQILGSGTTGAAAGATQATGQDPTSNPASSTDFETALLQQLGAGTTTGSGASASQAASQTQAGLLSIQEQASDSLTGSAAATGQHHGHHGHHAHAAGSSPTDQAAAASNSITGATTITGAPLSPTSADDGAGLSALLTQAASTALA